MSTFQERVNDKMQELLIRKVQGGYSQYENLREAIGDDDEVIENIFNLIFSDRLKTVSDYVELQDNVKHELVAYFGHKYEDECAEIVKAEDMDRIAYQRELADEMRRDQMRDERAAA